MENDWIMYWGSAFTRIAISQTIFSWTFLLVVIAVAVAYLFWMGVRSGNETEKNVSLFRRFFRFKWQEILVYFGMTGVILFVVATVGVSVTFHAAAFSEGMANGCLSVEEQNDIYVFTLPPDCAGRELLWNRVQLDKGEGRAAFDFLMKKSER